MSIGLMEKMFVAQFPSAGVKLVALRLADFADAQGRGIWPSLALVARECGVSEPTVRRAFKYLVEDVKILMLVKQGGKGPGSTNRYDFNMENVGRLKSVYDLEPAVAENCEKGCQGDTLIENAKGITDDAKGIMVTHKGIPGDTQTVKNRNNPYSQDAQAREREGDSGCGDDKQSSPPDTKAAKKAFRRGFARWPGYLTDSEAKAWAEWQQLTANDMADAEAGIEPYLAQNKADGRSFVVAFGTFLRERRWENLRKTEVIPDLAKNYAAPFGTNWGIVRFKHLLGQADANGRWSIVDEMHIRAVKNIGIPCKEKQPEMRACMEFVSVDYDMWLLWKACHERRGWPWFTDVGQRRGAWFPKGGPDGLAAFEQALRKYYQAKQPDETKQPNERSVGLRPKGPAGALPEAGKQDGSQTRSKKGATA